MSFLEARKHLCVRSSRRAIRAPYAHFKIPNHPYVDVSVAAQRTPTISYISQEQIKDIGETVELQCSVQYAQEYPILWIKVNKETVHEQVALSTGTALIIRDSRFSLKYDTASTTYILQVRSRLDAIPTRYLTISRHSSQCYLANPCYLARCRHSNPFVTINKHSFCVY